MSVFRGLVIWTVSLSLASHVCLCAENKHCRVLEKNVVDYSSLGLDHVPDSLPRNLTKLILRNNSFTTIPRKYFENFPNISDLDISHNNKLGLKHASVSFYGLRNSKIKRLVLNAIVPVDVGCVKLKKKFFRYLEKTYLTDLSLNENRILTIEPNTLNHAPESLQRLSLCHSRLILSETILKQLIGLKKLTVLDLSYLNGESYPPFTPNAIDLYQKHSGNSETISHNKQENDPLSVFIDVPPSLQTLIARGCYFKLKIWEMPINVIFTRNDLRMMDLRSNRIKEIRANLTGLENMEHLYLKDNVLEFVSPELPLYMPNLKTLSLAGNKLRFRNRRITNVPFKQLRRLDLSSNSIHAFETDALEGYSAITSLNFSNNIMHRFNVTIAHMKNLNSLDLSDNQITELTPYFIQQLEYLRSHGTEVTLSLTGNTLRCGCSNLAFIQWILQTNVSIVNKRNLYCFFYNDMMTNILIEDASEELENNCSSFHAYLLIGVLTALIGSMVIVLFGIVYRFRWKLRYLYYMARDKYRDSILNRSDETTFDYDAFISYAEEDAEFAVNSFIDVLETDFHLRLCLHQRDFRPGESIAANILSAIQRSRHVVIVLSPNFLDSYWCRWEFEMARMEGLYTERNVVVLVRYQEVPSSVVPRDLLYMMHTQTYLEYPDG